MLCRVDWWKATGVLENSVASNSISPTGYPGRFGLRNETNKIHHIQMETVCNKTKRKTKRKMGRRCEEWLEEDGSDQLETKDAVEEAMKRYIWESQNSQRVVELKEEERTKRTLSKLMFYLTSWCLLHVSNILCLSLGILYCTCRFCMTCFSSVSSLTVGRMCSIWIFIATAVTTPNKYLIPSNL